MCFQTLRIEDLASMLAFQYFLRHSSAVRQLGGAMALAGAVYVNVWRWSNFMFLRLNGEAA